MSGTHGWGARAHDTSSSGFFWGRVGSCTIFCAGFLRISGTAITRSSVGITNALTHKLIYNEFIFL